MTLQGCDVRLSAESARRNRYTPCHEGRCNAVATCRETLDRERRFLIENVLPRVHRTFVLNPELAHFVPGATFMPYASVDVEAIEPRYPRPRDRIVILHAPSDASIKGTAFIVEAVDKLKARFPIEFVLVKGLKHEEAMQLYSRADLVIDQVMAGWYGGFAVEAMAMGKPVLCYIRGEDLCHVPPAMAAEIPVLNAAPDSIDAVLGELLVRPGQFEELGRRSRAYALRWHNPRTIAAAMVRAYRDPTSSFQLAPSAAAPLAGAAQHAG
jgi:glycosyltransferase involved in cell wall biosynthesis